MSSIGQYIYSVITAATFVSILLSIIPGKGAASSVIKLSAGTFLIIVVMAPIVKVRLNNAITYIENIGTDASQLIADAQSHTDEQIVAVIKQEAETYILDKASNLGAEIVADITFQQNSPYIPESVTIIGAISPLAKMQLSATIAEELGIPEELQIWTLV